jgi:hypothetical protein
MKEGRGGNIACVLEEEGERARLSGGKASWRRGGASSTIWR